MRVRIEIEDGREEVDIIVKCGGKSEIGRAHV